MKQQGVETLTPRQIAGRLNRAKRKGITPEGRAALRESALRHRPWESSTGPKSTEGKRRSRWNALRHGGFAFTVLPIQVREFIRELRQAELAKGPLPISARPVQRYLNRFNQADSPRLVARLERLIARYQARCTLGHLRASTALLLAEGEMMMLAKGVAIPKKVTRMNYPYPVPFTQQSFALAMIVRLVQWRLGVSAEVLILDLYNGVWKAIVKSGDGDYFEVTAIQTPDAPSPWNWALVEFEVRHRVSRIDSNR